MPGFIKKEDIDAVRDRARIDEVVGEYVTLKRAGVGSLKGLCPFHDEKTPSFNVQPQVGRWHCFGCGEGGDVFSFVQRIDHLGFAEAVERLADRYGVELHYEEDTSRDRDQRTGKKRIMEANRIAAGFFATHLTDPEAIVARTFLDERGFDRDAATHFGVGYAPRGWDNLLKHMKSKGFTDEELSVTGLMSQGNRGLYDRFRGRLIWPIKDLTGDVVGFGARRIHDDDEGPKYLNTPETAAYKKAQVLYGLDLARHDIVKTKQIVIVEGYTDVMAAHLSGITTAVATCGTAFGNEHVQIVRRLLGDIAGAGGGVQLASGESMGGEVIFTFDGDEAGQKAAMRAFNEDQSFFAQTFIAVAPDGMDPCELRIKRGPEAVRDLIESKVPLYEFAIRSTLSGIDLNTREGQRNGLAVAAPVVARIRDHVLRRGYARWLSGQLGLDVEEVFQAANAASHKGGGSTGPVPRLQAPVQHAPTSVLESNDPITLLERQALEVALQNPTLLPAEMFDSMSDVVFTIPACKAAHDAIRAAGGLARAHQLASEGGSERLWVEAVEEEAPEPVKPLITQLAVRPLPAKDKDLDRYARGVLYSLIDTAMTRQLADVHSRMQRASSDPDSEEYVALLGESQELLAQRQRLRELE